jgi:F-box domain
MLNLNDFPTEVSPKIAQILLLAVAILIFPQLLVEIFDHVPLTDLFSASMVCQRWFTVIRKSRIGQKASVVIDQYNYLRIQEQGRTKCSKKYVETKIGFYKSAKWMISVQILKELYDPYLKNVQTLVLQCVMITVSLFQLLETILSLKHLRTLRILSVDLMTMEKSTGNDFTKLMDLELDILEYSFTYGYDYEEMENVELLLALLKYCRKIESLSIDMEFWDNESATSLTDLLRICEERCDNIKLDKLKLRIDDTFDETSNVTQYLKLIDSPKLKIRDFLICREDGNIPEPICHFELNTLAVLQSLDILASYCSSDELTLISNHAPNLHTLHFSLHSVPELSALMKLKYLKTLKIFFGYEVDNVVPTLMMNPLLELKQLEHLELNGNPHVLEVEEHTLSPENCLAKLKTFSMEIETHESLGIDAKSIKTMESIMRRMKSLENFSFDKVGRIFGLIV